MPSHVLDLDAYFVRIGYAGPRTASLTVLREIHLRHVRTIPFENLDIHLGRSIAIDLASIERKLVRGRRGGYCFEHNGLFAGVLRALGFAVAPLVGRVRWQVPAEQETALTHMILRVDTDAGPHLADVGFGSMSLFAPLRFEFDIAQSGSLEPRRLVHRGPLIVQQARIGETWSDIYQFSLESVPAIDFELGNWFTSTHPQSRFVQNLVVARAGDDCRYTLLNRDFAVRYADGHVEQRTLTSPEELLAVLAQIFGLEFPPGTRFGSDGAPSPR
jgi:N-hydroxyarylamine O-acetyltransferase